MSKHSRALHSRYAGDGLNNALVSPEKVEAILDRVKAAAAAVVSAEPGTVEKAVVAEPGDLAKSPGNSKTVWTSAFAGVGAVVTAAGDFLGGLDWRVQLFISAAPVGFGIYGIKRRADLAKAVRARTPEDALQMSVALRITFDGHDRRRRDG